MKLFVLHKSRFTDLKLVKTLPFSSSTCRIQCIFCMVWAGWSLLTFVNFVTCKRSITFELSVKGVLKHIYIYIWIVHFFLGNAFNLWMLLPWNICSTSIFWFTIATLWLTITTITVKHAPATSNCNIFAQIIDNMLKRNTTRRSWVPSGRKTCEIHGLLVWGALVGISIKECYYLCKKGTALPRLWIKVITILHTHEANQGYAAQVWKWKCSYSYIWTQAQSAF